MAFDDRSLDDYIDVPQRIADFRERYPEGSLQPADTAMPYHVVRVPAHWCQRCIGRRQIKSGGNWKTCPRCTGTGLRGDGEPAEDVFIVYTAAAYRSPDDKRPGIGQAWEAYPGRTPYTAESELMNAETSAWGRAIVAALASDAKKGVASRDEVRNRAAEHDDGTEEVPKPRAAPRQRPPSRPAATPVLTATTGPDHERLRNGTVVATPDDRIADRGPLPDDANPRQGKLPEELPGSADPKDVKAIHAAYGKLGFKASDRNQLLATTEQLIGRQLNTGPNPGRTHNNLTWHEARPLMIKLQGFGEDRAKLSAHLATILQGKVAVAAHAAAESSQDDGGTGE